MKKNVGPFDRTIRVLAALAIGVILLTGAISGIPAIVLGVIAALLLITAAVSTCPLYLMLQFSTAKKSPPRP